METNEMAIIQLRDELSLKKDGFFELYKRVPSIQQEKTYDTVRLSIEKIPQNVLANGIKEEYIYFSIYLCLMVRYTQNYQITGIGMLPELDRVRVMVETISFDEMTTFQDVVLDLCRHKSKTYVKRDNLLESLQYISMQTGYLFEFGSDYTTCLSTLESGNLPELRFKIVSDFNKVELNIIYRTDLYDRYIVEHMASHYRQFLRSILEEPKQVVSRIFYLDELEKDILVNKWNQTESSFPRESCLHQLFEQRVLEDPLAVAVYYEDKELNRQTLNEMANQLAYRLLELGSKKGDIISVYSDKSVEYIIAILGILKAGCAYLPIDSSYPESRVEYILDDSQTRFVVMKSNVELEDNFISKRGLSKIIIDVGGRELSSYSIENPKITVNPEDPCYLIYTSGSTGEPKGALLNHIGRVNNFHDFNVRFSVTSQDKTLAVSSVSFDMCAYDVWGMLMVGGAIILPDAAMEKQPFHWLKLIRKYQVTIWHSVPVLLDLLCRCCEHRKTEHIDSIRLVLLGGDWIPLTLPSDFKRLNSMALLVSMGGATEVSMDSTIYYPIDDIPTEWKSIPYGRPMYNQKAYVLDKNKQLMPIGFPGELYLGGIGVGDGYYNKPELTAERFFKNPWIDDPAQRIYKTGDLVLYEPDGNLRLLGRIDFQVKVNGTRIELGEIEHCLMQYKSVKRAVAIAPFFGATRKIVVYVDYRKEYGEPTQAELYEHMNKQLPHNYIPTYLIVTYDIPITPNGKIDRKQLENLTFDYVHSKIGINE
jgi:amino acid adenylation domain-containing protein